MARYRFASGAGRIPRWHDMGILRQSTFFKQLRMCHGSPWTADELLTFKTAVDRMVINDIIRLAMATQNAAILEAFPEKLVFSPSVETVIYKVTQWMIEREIPNTLTEEVASYIYRLWTDETIRKVRSRSSGNSSSTTLTLLKGV